MNTSPGSGDLEYIFWLRGWIDKSVSFWAKLGRFKCIITRRKISVIPANNDPDKKLSLDISWIQKCELYGSENSNRSVGLVLNDRIIMLIPINPFDPTFIALANNHESAAMRSVIDAFRTGIDLTVDTNPYLRQHAASKINPSRFRGLTKKWEQSAKELDQHISPWDYYETYGDKFFVLKSLAFVLLSAITITALGLALAYVLDILNIM